MMRHITSIAALLLLGVSVFGQTPDRAVEKIRTYYREISEKVRLAETDDEQGQIGDLVMNELVINKRNHQWRAVGIFRETYKFFYQGGDSEEHLYPDQLVKTVVTKRISNRKYTEEYLYGASGELMFYFEAEGSDDVLPIEKRVYFSGRKAIRIVEGTKTRDHLTTKDLATVREIVEQSRRVKEIFIKSTKL